MSAKSSRDYHLAELAVARSRDDHRRSVPDIPEGSERVLDIGCGAGQTLMACDLKGAQPHGIELDLDAIRLGQNLSLGIHFACGGGELLPYRDASFDMVWSRVVMPYMHIPTAISEAARVLRVGGHIWLTLHALSMFSLRRALHNHRTAVFEAYRLLNTVTLHLCGRQFRYPLRRSVIESYQTEFGISRVLLRHGFEDLRMSKKDSQFLVQARKRR